MVMPQMGESIAEATISKWRKQPGESVKKDEVILEISTDKVDSEIPAPASGTLSELLFKEGDVVPVKTIIAKIDTEGGAAAAPAAPAKAALVAAPTPNKEAPIAVAKAAPAPASAHHEEEGSRYYSPLVKSLAEKHGITMAELESIPGSGEAGRVNKQDLLNFIDGRGARSTAATPPAAAAPVRASTPAPQSARPAGESYGNDITVVPMDNMRQAIAAHMVRSKATSPHVYSIQEIDVTAVSAWRKANKKKFEDKEGFNLSFTPFFLEAAVRALLQFPIVNSSVEGNKILYKKSINLGCAVALGEGGKGGLIVPVIKRADEKNLVGIARGLNELAQKARTKKLLPDDVAGGTFTVTNPGTFGTMIGNPIINQPQVAILSLGAIKKRPVVINDMIAIREVCYLTLSYDHRIIDGAVGGQFLAFIREYLEGWDKDRPLY